LKRLAAAGRPELAPPLYVSSLGCRRGAHRRKRIDGCDARLTREYLCSSIVLGQCIFNGCASRHHQGHGERVAPGLANEFVIALGRWGDAVESGNVSIKSDAAQANGGDGGQKCYSEKQPDEIAAAPAVEIFQAFCQPKRRLTAFFWNRH